VNPKNPFHVLNRYRELQELRAKATVKSARQMRIEVLLVERQKCEIHLQELESEFDTLQRYRDSGKYDRFAFREEMEPLESKLRDARAGLTKINEELNRLENDFETQYLKALEAWDQRYSESVHYFSIFSVSSLTGVSEYLLIPEKLRIFCPDGVLTLLSDSSPLGSACLHRSIGEHANILTPRGFGQEVEVLVTKRVDEEILESICHRIGDSDYRKEFYVSIDPSFGGDIQRWQDAARARDYIQCSKCGSYFVLNSFCRNC